MNDKEIKYVIEYEGDIFTLYSIVDTTFGGSAKNFICEGSREYCEKNLSDLKRKQDGMLKFGSNPFG